ncbi:ATP-dependent RecD-like DNA helicase [Heyndrickxia acidiproducens]|uniref:SF1B family DNA helicase RecD2 n=1 Tax=Heyndrickxia acidiproducens TaxID=1121084 RepID=UPI0003668B0D|nr:ATP-dependent RecD-like DNA helicase [Heyndrickxia acidiproducens]
MEKQHAMDLFQDQEKYIKGKHLVTIFHNEQNLYSVIRVRIEETNEELHEKEAVITGYFPRIHEQETYTFFGKMQEHPKFGPQFQASRFQKEIPNTKQGVVDYLSSNLFNGIGKKTAERIVEALGENAISKILENPSVLEKVPKLAADKAQLLHETLMEHQGLERVMIGLNQFGFGAQIAMRIYQVYKDEALETIKKNPYQLVEDIEGIGFGRADELGRKLGISGNHPHRIQAGCQYTLETESMQNGHVYLEADELARDVKTLLEEYQNIEIPIDMVNTELLKLQEESKVVMENGKVYLPSLYFSEKGIVSNIERLMSQTEYEEQFPESKFLLALGELEERIGVEYAPSQREAIQKALMSPMMILTGGPGTGKTTVIKGIVELYGELHGCSLDPDTYKKDETFPIVLAAPTGRAAKRMAESTELPAMTIHRLLGMNGQETLDNDEKREVEGKLLIVDEMSMVDTWLANQLLKALPDDIQVIMVGDEDQLPSVGPGQVLKDLLKSGVIPTVRLTDIYRQKDGSSIIELAHCVKEGIIPENVMQQQADRSFIRCSAGQIPEAVEKVVESAKRKGYSAKDVQVLAPMYRGPAGIDRLNRLLQDLFNPNETGTRKEMKHGDVVYRIGDKVLQLVNQPEHQVYNGDIGEIISIFTAKENTEKQDMMIVSFEGIEVTYTRPDFNQITLAYCCSIHKSQGSEFPVVILPVVRSYYRMLRRNLLYTAVTRSKKILILLGEESAFRMGIEREDDQKRKTTLCEKLQALKPAEKIPGSTNGDRLFLTEENWNQVDPMIGMEEITPYCFMAKNEKETTNA